MKVLYNILTYVATFHLKIAALFNSKLKLGIKGRSKTFSILKSKINNTDNVFWFHCASLGEYEQGLPLFEELKKEFPNHKVVVTFFSPSGYEIKKNTPMADVVVYLPFDTKANAKRFINIVHPELAIFVKYEIWPNYLSELHSNNIKTLLISALFREKQLFFKWYGKFMKKALFSFTHIFTQDDQSKTLLNSIGIENVTISGDTRFDRVTNQLKIDNSLNFVSEFKQDKLLVVVGSSWQEDENLIVPFINNESINSVKFIIAPHNIKESQVRRFKKIINKETVLYSEKENQSISNAQVLILDTIGLLTKVYSYADIAYVGGAMGTTGLHNTLEPAVFGTPIIIGENYEKFPEAQAMLKQGLFSVSNQNELTTILNALLNNPEKRKLAGKKNKEYINKNRGAVIQIIDYIRKYS